jgi:hypothetical protein
MALTQITIVVAIDDTNHTFTATSEEESSSGTSFAGAVSGLLPKMAALHDQLQGIPDGDLSQEGKDFRDTPLVFS